MNISEITVLAMGITRMLLAVVRQIVIVINIQNET